MTDVGSGSAIVLIPGIQGRWEWARTTVEALARRHRVLAFSLCDEPTSGFPCVPARGFDNFVTQVAAAMDRAGIGSATIVGVSYGGLVATEFAARFPDRTSALTLVSALPPGWVPDARVRRYLRWPRLLSPLFCVTAPARLYAEVAAALPEPGPRLRFAVQHLWRVTRAPLSPSRMARRVRWAEEHRFADPRTISAPVLILTGEPHLDHVVPVALSLQLGRQMPSARQAVLARTGHLGLVTRPGEFASIVGGFADEVSATSHSDAAAERQRAS